MVRRIELILAALLLLGLFSPEAADTDSWWHLTTGRFVVEHRALPVPDPFAFTTAGARDAYAGESVTRYFNLTHEWLAQVAMYLAYRAGGFAGMILWRATLLAAFCGLAGWIAYRRSRGYYRSIAAAFLVAWVASGFAYDRPYLLTFLFVAVAIATLEAGRPLWLLPPLFVVWSNCHGGFVLGWLVVAAYTMDAWLRRRDWRPGAWGAAAIVASGLNPNGFHVIPVLLHYRQSFLQSKLLEWSAPPLWPPQPFELLMAGAALVLLWQRRRVRPVDWLLFVVFAAAGLSAQRNTVLIGFLAPVLMVMYMPWKRPVPRFARYAVSGAMALVLIAGMTTGSFFQLRAAEWRFPKGAADFLLAHHVSGRMFNTYEYGGYLMWRLWPRERVFIDGRALSESVFLNYARILYNRDASDGGRAAGRLLDAYGIQLIVMNSFEYSNGLLYLLAPSLADPAQKTWKLVYSDPQAMVMMREPPAGVQAMNPARVLDHIEQECDLHIEKEPKYPRCARALGQMFSKMGDFTLARRWVGIYLSHPHAPDPEAEQAYAQILQMGR